MIPQNNSRDSVEPVRRVLKDLKNQWKTKETYRKRCLTPLDIKKMQIKIMRYFYALIRMAEIKRTENTKCCQGFGTTGILINC